MSGRQVGQDVPGKREVVVSRRLAARFANFEAGGKFKTGGKELTVTLFCSLLKMWPGNWAPTSRPV